MLMKFVCATLNEANECFIFNNFKIIEIEYLVDKFLQF